MINLIDNAIGAMDGRGYIGVTLSYDTILKIVRLELNDTGTGISPEGKIRLFEQKTRLGSLNPIFQPRRPVWDWDSLLLAPLLKTTTDSSGSRTINQEGQSSL
jgi:hypothetical protein